MVTIERITSELHKAYNLCNKAFFNNGLPTVAITIQSPGKRKLSMGWCTQKEVWGDKEGKVKMYEINLSPEFLDLDFYETMDTLMHEMVHLYNLINDIQDVSRNGTYHNKHFKNESIKRGFYYEDDKPDSQYGWSFSKLTDETKQKLDQLDINKDVFKIARRSANYFKLLAEGLSPEEAQKKDEQQQAEIQSRKSFKWVCNGCGLIVRSTKDNIHIKCGDCDMRMILD